VAYVNSKLPTKQDMLICMTIKTHVFQIPPKEITHED
jgi:hypothetical protein